MKSIKINFSLKARPVRRYGESGSSNLLLFYLNFCILGGGGGGGGGSCAKIVFACRPSTNTLQRHFSVTLNNY